MIIDIIKFLKIDHDFSMQERNVYDDIKYIYDENKQDDFWEYFDNIKGPNVRPFHILFTYVCYDEEEIELFEEYCELGMWSEDAKNFIDEEIEMTEQRKEIYFALVNRVDEFVLHDCVENNIMRDLTTNPLNEKEQHMLSYTLREHQEIPNYY